MKNAFIYRGLLFLSLASSLGCTNDTMEEVTEQALDYTDTGLPVIYINTESGEDIASKDIYEEATIRIDDNKGRISLAEQNMQIHGRGNSSWYTFTKKRSYTIKLNSKEQLLGMPKDKKWVLLANYRDKTLIRNSIAWWISSNIKQVKWTPQFHFVELVLNGQHRGTYQLVEQIKISENRLNINKMRATDSEPENITGGYIIELDRNIDTDQWEWIMPNMCSDVNRISIKEPKIDESNDVQYNYIYNYLTKIDSLFGEGNIETVMGKYIDMRSWATQWLIYEITGTPEPNGPNSWDTYKDRGDEKWHCGPAWDFDYKSFVPSTSNKWINRDVIYLPQMLEYEPFRETLKQVWEEIEPLLPELIEYIEEQNILLERSATLNWSLYDKCLITDNRIENGDEFLSPYVAKLVMIEYLRKKWDFISKNIGNI